MFGVDPEQLRAQRMQRAYEQNMQMAQLDPAQRATAAWGNIGSGLFEMGARAAGLQTPEERIATVRQQAFSQLNQDDPESFKKAALMLNQEGDTRGAAMLVQAGREVEKGQAAAQAQAEKERIAQAQLELKEAQMNMQDEANRRRDEKMMALIAAKEKSAAQKDGGMKDSDRLKFKVQHQKDYSTTNSMINTANDAVRKANEVISDKDFGYMFGGYTEKYASKLGTQKIADINQKLESLKANLMKSGLDLMRQGGGIGAMTEREWPIMQAQIAALDPKMSEAGAKEALKNVMDWMNRAKKEAGDIYKISWGDEEKFYRPELFDKANSGYSSSSQPESKVRKIVKTGTANGKKVVQYDDGSIEYAN